MKLMGRILAGKTDTLMTKKGERLQKTRLKLLDLGEEVNGDVQVYWIDLLGENALSEGELAHILHQEVVVDIRRVSATAGKQGGAFLNLTGGLVYLNDKVMQGTVR